MKLIYCYIGKFRNIVNQEVCLTSDWDVHYVNGRLEILRKDANEALDYLYGKNYIKDLYVVVGKTGSGKTNFLQLIGQDSFSRTVSERSGDQYVMLYKMQDTDKFAAEIMGLEIEGLTEVVERKVYQDKKLSVQFRYDVETKSYREIKPLSHDDKEHTCIINAFDRYSFAHCPYDDERQESFHDQDDFLPRMIIQFGNSSASIECDCLKEYLGQFPDDNIKRHSAFELKWDNWQYKMPFDLDEELEQREYWTYRSRAQEQRDANFRNGKYNEPIVYPKGSTPKSRFIHDLMTDFAIYLRKWAEKVDPDFPEKYFSYCGYVHDLGVDNPRVLPDGVNMSILKRIDWLCQYLDYHTDEMKSNQGLIWQIGCDIRDLFHILNKMDEKYFTDEKFSIPVVEIDNTPGQPMADLFERLDQYRPDEVGIFTKKLLPFTWTYVSSGESQYAKVWGILEEYCVRAKLLKQGERYEDAVQPNLILLIDEPENYMHPEMCRNFISKMHRVMDKRCPGTEFQVIMSTHSPFMLSDVLSEQVIRMDYDDRGMCVITQKIKSTFAANIHSIMADSFFLEYTIGEQARLILTEKFSFLKDCYQRRNFLSNEDLAEISRIGVMAQNIGDELIRYSFTSIIEKLL